MLLLTDPPPDQRCAYRCPQRKGWTTGRQLELLLARIEELCDGTFTPLSQQPLVRAMLLPIGNFSGTALLEYLLLPGLS